MRLITDHYARSASYFKQLQTSLENFSSTVCQNAGRWLAYVLRVVLGTKLHSPVSWVRSPGSQPIQQTLCERTITVHREQRDPFAQAGGRNKPSQANTTAPKPPVPFQETILSSGSDNPEPDSDSVKSGLSSSSSDKLDSSEFTAVKNKQRKKRIKHNIDKDTPITTQPVETGGKPHFNWSLDNLIEQLSRGGSGNAMCAELNNLRTQLEKRPTASIKHRLHLELASAWCWKEVFKKQKIFDLKITEMRSYYAGDQDKICKVDRFASDPETFRKLRREADHRRQQQTKSKRDKQEVIPPILRNKHTYIIEKEKRGLAR